MNSMHVSINQSINQITMRVLSPMREVALVKSILQAELLIHVAKCLMSFNVTKRTVNQSSVLSLVLLRIGSKYCRSGIPDCWQVVLVEHFVLAQRVAGIRHFLTPMPCMYQTSILLCSSINVQY